MTVLVLYSILVAIGFVTGLIYSSYQPSFFEKSVMMNLRQGKRVIICVNDDAYIFEMEGTRVKITQGVTNFSDMPVDLSETGE